MSALPSTHGASFPSGDAGERREPPPALSLRSTSAPAEWLNLPDLLDAFAAPTAKARHEAARRWWKAQPVSSRQKVGGRLQVLADNATRLPNGLSPLAHAKGCRAVFVACNPPPGHETWSPDDMQRFLDTQELLRVWDQFRFAHPRETEANLIARFTAPPLATPLRLSLRRLRAYRRRLRIDGNVDRRGRNKGMPPPDNETLAPSGEIVDAAWDHFKKLYLDPRKRSVTLCYELVAAEAEKTSWTWPALRTIQMRVARELPPSIADYWREGVTRWERAHAPRMEGDYSVYRPNQCWVGDNHRFDVLVLHRGAPLKPWLSAFLDKRSRVVIGWQVGAAANSDTILAAFSRGAKEYGVPLQLVIDNGKDFGAQALVGKGVKRGRPLLDEDRLASVFGRLNVDVNFCLPFEPQSKHIESFFRTVCAEFSKLWESYTGGRPDDRPEDLYDDLRRRRIVPPSLEEFAARFAEWVRTVYHLRPHTGDGMDGRTPAEVFQVDPIAKRSAPAELLDVLLMRTKEATVDKRGVRHNKTWYGQGNLELQRLHGRKVLLGVNPADAGMVKVFDAQTGAHLTDAHQQRLAGVTVEEIREGAKRIARAKRRCRQAGPALRDRCKSLVEHALDVQAESLAQQPGALAATGTDDSRPLSLLPSSLGSAASARVLHTQCTQPPAPDYEPVTFTAAELDDLAGSGGGAGAEFDDDEPLDLTSGFDDSPAAPAAGDADDWLLGTEAAEGSDD